MRYNIEQYYPDHWKPYVSDLFVSDIQRKLDRERCLILPFEEEVFKPFEIKMEDIKVVIIGKHDCNVDYSCGLTMSIPSEVPKEKYPTYTEGLHDELKHFGYSTNTGNLQKWHDQGVFLLSKELTTRYRQKNSHALLWEPFIAKVINAISKNKKHCVWMCFSPEIKPVLLRQVKNKDQLVLTYFKKEGSKSYFSGSPYQPHKISKYYWIGNGCFLQCNEYLRKNGLPEIDWNL